MILAFDTYYAADNAKTVAIAFTHWSADTIHQTYTDVSVNIAPYEPGAFYKRELPCIRHLLQQIDTTGVSHIIIDGFVYLDDNGSPGLGAHLYNSLHQSIPVIGVAKTNFQQLMHHKVPVLRGNSNRPLFITAAGMDIEIAASHIRMMHGENRIPSLLKQLDGLTRA